MKLLLVFLLTVFSLAVFSPERLRPRPAVLLFACVVVSGGYLMRRFV